MVVLYNILAYSEVPKLIKIYFLVHIYEYKIYSKDARNEKKITMFLHRSMNNKIIVRSL